MDSKNRAVDVLVEQVLAAIKHENGKLKREIDLLKNRVAKLEKNIREQQ